VPLRSVTERGTGIDFDSRARMNATAVLTTPSVRAALNDADLLIYSTLVLLTATRPSIPICQYPTSLAPSRAARVLAPKGLIENGRRIDLSRPLSTRRRRGVV
jgi:hypothetical protein